MYTASYNTFENTRMDGDTDHSQAHLGSALVQEAFAFPLNGVTAIFVQARSHIDRVEETKMIVLHMN